MSSFKRKGSAKEVNLYPGTRSSPVSPSTVITSTGIPSLDDILGGGLPLSCSLLVAAPDFHSSYGILVQKYFVAQGLDFGHRLCIIEDNAEGFAKDIMWVPRSRTTAPEASAGSEEEQKSGDQEDQKIKIAWRYESMKPFQTTVPSSSSYSADDYCSNFDLTSRVPPFEIEQSIRSGQLSSIPTNFSNHDRTSTSQVLDRILSILRPEGEASSPPSTPLRICIPSLGSPHWGELSTQDILHFLHSLRSILRRHPYACASVSLAPHVSTDSWGGPGWIQQLGWVSDAALTLSAFSADPSLTAVFPSHHGLLHIHTLPAPHTLLPPSDKFSTLRGLSASAGATGGSENNLTFKSTRKRLIFETLHLDIEGGVGERRTRPATNALDETSGAHGAGHKEHSAGKTAFAAVEVAFEDLEIEKSILARVDGGDKATEVPLIKPKKQKKSVAFRADRPDLYDF